MREILFRGKRKDNGEWVEGYLLNTRWYETEREIVAIVPQRNFVHFNSVSEWYAVDPATVGQYTGLTDKNGKRIFEGDVVHIEGFETWVNGSYIVEFADVNHCWWLQNPYLFGKSFSFSDLNGFHEDCEIIGNIHDNPDLLGGNNP